jgi:hypothetical protein
MEDVIKMGIFDSLKLLFMSNNDTIKLASNPNTPKDILIKLCKYGDNKVRETLAGNPNVPKDIFIENLTKAITNKKKNIRESAIETISKIPDESVLTLDLSLRLTILLKESDWYRSIDIVRALGVIRSIVATDTICSLIWVALEDLNTYGSQEAYYALQGEYIEIQTDTDDLPLDPTTLYTVFIKNAIIALGEIGDPDAVDTLKGLKKKKIREHKLDELVDDALKKI